MSRLLITLLGSMQVQLDEKPVTLAYDKVRALLAYLALESKRPLRRDILTGLLWPDQPDKKARHSLSQALLKLRHAIDPNGNLLLTNRQTVQLNPSADVKIDAVVFEAQLTQCQSHTHVRPETCTQCMSCRKTAVTLYQGNFLSGLTIPGTHGFDDWLTIWRERLHRQMMEALDVLAHYHERRGELITAIDYARQQVSLEPWREETHRQLMRLLFYNGQRSAALAQYHICVQVMDAELSVAPSEETNNLFNQIQTAEAHIPHNLPPQATPFLGREKELADLAVFLTDPDNRLLTIVGQGGIGKTRLALATADKQVSRHIFTHGVFFVSLVAVETAVSLIPTIADALNLRFETGQTASSRTPQQQLIDYCRQKRLLLLLDNFEQLLLAGNGAQSIAFLTDLLQQAPNLQLLVTSRERLQLQEEQVYLLAGLAHEHATDNGVPSTSETIAMALFQQSAQRIQPDFHLDGIQTVAVAEICTLLSGMPLAIELAANLVNVLTPAEITLELAQNLDVLATSARNVPERHQSMRAAFLTSWQRLTPDEKAAFSQLSIFRGGFTREAAQAVTDVTLATLSSLVNQSLLHFDPLNQRYQIHELLRQYGAEELADDVEVETAVCDQHCIYYSSYLHQTEKELKGTNQQTALSQLDIEIENSMIAWQWACKSKNVTTLHQGMNGMLTYYSWRARYLEGVQACQRAIDALTNITSNQACLTQSRLHSWLGYFLASMGQVTDGQMQLEKGIALLNSPSLAEIDKRAEKAFALYHLSRIASKSDREESRRLAEESTALYLQLNDKWAEANGYNLLGRITRGIGLLEESRSYLENSLLIRQKLEVQRDIAKSYLHLSLVAMDQGSLEETMSFMQKGLVIFEQMDDRLSMAHSNNSIGMLIMFMGKFREGEPYFVKAKTIFDELGIRTKAMTSQIWISGSQINTGAYEDAMVTSLECRHYFAELEYPYESAFANMVLGWAMTALGRLPEAKQYLQQSITIFRQLGYLKELSESLSSYAFTYCEENELPITRQYCQQALITASKTGALLPLCFAIAAVARLRIAEESVEQAIELYALIMEQPIISESRYFDVVLGNHITAISDTLSPDIVTSAQEKGKRRDLWETAEELLDTLSLTNNE